MRFWLYYNVAGNDHVPKQSCTTTFPAALRTPTEVNEAQTVASRGAQMRTWWNCDQRRGLVDQEEKR